METKQGNPKRGRCFYLQKREEAYGYEYPSEAEFRKSVEAYVNFYNHVRLHQTLVYTAPSRFEELYGKE